MIVEVHGAAHVGVACEGLVRATLYGGAPDNVTVVVALTRGR